jgi:zinc protease
VRTVTATDVQRVAKQYLAKDNRTVGILIPTKPVGAAAGIAK